MTRWSLRQDSVIFEVHITATHCNTLQHTATHCNTLQHTATHCNKKCDHFLRRTSLSNPAFQVSQQAFMCARCASRNDRISCCSVLQCVAVCCSAMRLKKWSHFLLQCVAVCCSVLQCSAPQEMIAFLEAHLVHIRCAVSDVMWVALIMCARCASRNAIFQCTEKIGELKERGRKKR